MGRGVVPNALVRPLLGVDFSHTALHKELGERCDIALDGGREELRELILPTRCIFSTSRAIQTNLFCASTVVAFMLVRHSKCGIAGFGVAATRSPRSSALAPRLTSAPPLVLRRELRFHDLERSEETGVRLIRYPFDIC